MTTTPTRPRPATDASTSAGRTSARRGAGWTRRLQTRVMLALAVLGIMGVGASGYLVQLTVRYFDEVGAGQTMVAREVVGHSKLLYDQLVATQRDNFRLRAEALAQSLEHALAPAHEAQTADRPVDRSVQFEKWLDSQKHDDVSHIDVLVAGESVAVGGAGSPEPGSRPVMSVRVPVNTPETDLVLSVTFVVSAELTRDFESLDVLAHELDTVNVDGTRVERRAVVRAVVVALAVASLLVLVVALAAGAMVARTVTRRMSEISTVMRNVAKGDICARAPPHGHDEIGQLAVDLNTMLDELAHTREKVAYLQRIGAWQDIARRIAHEIKNPLTPIQLAAAQMRQKGLPRLHAQQADLRRMLQDSVEIIDDEVSVIRRLVDSFSQFARVPQVRLEPIELGEVVEEFARAYGHTGDEEGEPIEIEQAGERLLMHGDRQLLKQTLVNLVENAWLSIRESGGTSARVRVRTLAPANPGDRIELIVEDNGPGIAPERRDEVFEPYVTSRESGTGLGLAIVKKIVLDHGGEIHIDESPLGGALFRLRFPSRASEPSP